MPSSSTRCASSRGGRPSPRPTSSDSTSGTASEAAWGSGGINQAVVDALELRAGGHLLRPASNDPTGYTWRFDISGQPCGEEALVEGPWREDLRFIQEFETTLREVTR